MLIEQRLLKGKTEPAHIGAARPWSAQHLPLTVPAPQDLGNQ